MTTQNQKLPESKAQTLWQKLFIIQKSFIEFGNTEDSGEKIKGSRDSAYKYTPGWQITETIREKMDEMGIMMPMNVVSEDHTTVEFPIYKKVNGIITKFLKRDILSTLKVEYSFIDVTTGETIGPFSIVSSGANKIDKSTASAISMAERYIFLKFFHIATHDKSDEPDANDSSFIPGIPEEQQPVDATDDQISKAQIGIIGYPQKVQSTKFVPQQYPPQPMPQSNGYPPYQPYPPYQQENGNDPYAQELQYEQPDCRQPQPSAPQAHQQPVDKNTVYQLSVMALANYEKGTPSFKGQLSKSLIELNKAGFPTSDPSFLTELVDNATKRREGK
jgi:hypothetical protein